MISNLVMVRDELKPRLRWPIGVVFKLYPGSDGIVRAVDVKTLQGIIKRSVQKFA